MPFQTFHVFNVFHSVALAPHWTLEHLHACTSQKVFGKCKCWNFAENIWMETMFLIFGGPISKRFAGVNMFWRCLTTGFFKEHFRYMPTYFLMKHFGRHFKKNGNTMAPVRCCKNQIEFLWSIATRCLPEDVLLQIFWNNIYTCPKYVWGI